MVTKASVLRVTGYGAALLGLLAWSSANAGGYFGIGYGSSKMKDASTALIGTAFDDKDKAIKLFGGYEFNPNVAVEASYVDFGEFTGKIGTTVTDRWEANALDLAVVGKIPLGNFSLHGKLGLALWNVDDTFVGISASESGTGISYGLGFQYNFTKQFGLRMDWEKYTDVGDANATGQSDLSTMTASVVFKF